MYLNTNHKSIDLTSIFFAILVTFPCINYYIGELYWAFDLENPFAEFIYALIYAVGMMSIIRNINTFKINSLVLLAFLLFYSFILTPQAVPEYAGPSFIRSPLAQFLFIFFPVFLLSSDKKFNYSEALNLLSYFALVPLSLMLVAFVFQAIVNGTGIHEYMAFAYMALPMEIVVLYYSWTTSGRILGRVLSALAFLTILFGGCRGALVTLLMFMVLSVVLFSTNRWRRAIIIILGLLIVLSLSPILHFLTGLLNSMGVESRIFGYIEAGEIAESNARMLVYRKAISVISVIGHGIYSDRALIGGVEDAYYCHNWVLEFLVDYGWAIGGILVFLIIKKLITIVSGTSSTSSHYHKFMLFFALSMLGVKFMISNSYLNSFEIALIFGWMAFLSRNKIIDQY